MKRIIFLIMLMVGFVAAGNAQKLVSSKSFGSKGLYEVIPTNDTISVTPKYSASAYVMDVDTTVTLQVDTIKSNPCNLVYFQLTADGTKRYVNFGSGLTAAQDSLSANKTRVWGFVFIKNKYILTHRTQEY